MPDACTLHPPLYSVGGDPFSPIRGNPSPGVPSQGNSPKIPSSTELFSPCRRSSILPPSSLASNGERSALPAPTRDEANARSRLGTAAVEEPEQLISEPVGGLLATVAPSGVSEAPASPPAVTSSILSPRAQPRERKEDQLSSTASSGWAHAEASTVSGPDMASCHATGCRV
eukprot:scaffold72791_cov26-Tisochrysis_lutea.AAC.1